MQGGTELTGREKGVGAMRSGRGAIFGEGAICKAHCMFMKEGRGDTREDKLELDYRQ